LQSLKDTHRDRWLGLRSEESVYSQARTAAISLSIIVLTELGQVLDNDEEKLLRRVTVGEVTPRHITEAISLWKRTLSAGTINKRLDCLGLMGAPTKGRRQRRAKTLKWWLKPDVAEKLVNDLRRLGDPDMADYILWTTRTGLRVEESLKLRRQDFAVLADGRVTVTVPGLKTTMAQATLPLGDEAASIFRRRFGEDAAPHTRFFPIGYRNLCQRWNLCRVLIGAARDPLATLKSLRRSAARYLHVERGMSLDMVRHYLRHENVATTMEYLRLTGGYEAQEYGKWL
jgi:integrase